MIPIRSNATQTAKDKSCDPDITQRKAMQRKHVPLLLFLFFFFLARSQVLFLSNYEKRACVSFFFVFFFFVCFHPVSSENRKQKTKYPKASLLPPLALPVIECFRWLLPHRPKARRPTPKARRDSLQHSSR